MALEASGVAVDVEPDIYWLVEKDWPARGPRELNPADPVYAQEEQMFLSNLRPDFFIGSPERLSAVRVEGATVIELRDQD